MTTDPAATTAPSPIVIPGKITDWVPIQTSFPILILLATTGSLIMSYFNYNPIIICVILFFSKNQEFKNYKLNNWIQPELGIKLNSSLFKISHYTYVTLLLILTNILIL